MQYRKLGRTDLDVSAIGFGAWAIGGGWGPQAENDSLEALNRAIDLGVNFIDSAAGYGNGKSERLIAQVLKVRKEKVWAAVSTVIPGIRNGYQAEANTAATNLAPLPESLLLKLREHAWLRGF